MRYRISTRVFVLALLLSMGCTSTGDSADENNPPPPASKAKAAGGPAQEPKQLPAKSSKKRRRIFVSNYQGDTISVVEGSPEMEVKTFAAGPGPHGMAIRPNEPRLLAVANAAGLGVTFFNPDTFEQVADFPNLTRGPQDVVFSADGKTLFVVGTLEFKIHFIDVDAMKEIKPPLGVDLKPRRAILSPDGKALYVLLVAPGDGKGTQVGVVDIKTRKITKTIPIDIHPRSMALGNNGRYLVTDSFDNSTLTVIDTTTHEVIAVHKSPTGMGLAVHPTKPLAYPMESFDGEFYVFDLEKGKVTKTIVAGQWPTYPEVGPDGRYLYIPHEESDSLVKFDLETEEVAMKVVVGKEPIEVAIYDY